MEIVVLDGYTLNPGDLSWDSMKKLGNVTVHERTPVDPKSVLKTIGNASIIFTNKTPLPKEVINNAPYLKYIGVLATGYNVVDITAAINKGVIVTNVPAYSTTSVAQMTMALLLEMCHNTGLHSNAVHDGEWTKNENFSFWKTPLIELAGKTFGIIGFGTIGQATAKLAQAFGMQVITYSRTKKPALETSTCKFVSLDVLLKESDFISLHCPLFPETQGIVNTKNISKMKDGVKIINTSRGQLVIEEDLKLALENGKVSGAALDVVSVEPIENTNPLLGVKNCIITPHIAWAPKESRARLLQTAIHNLEAYLDNKPVNVIKG